PPAALQNLDLVAIRVFGKEEAGKLHAIVLEIDQLADLEAEFCEAGMFCIDIIDRHGKMTIAIAQIVRFGAPLVDGQLDFKIGFRIAQIDQREGVEIDALCNIEAASLIVEGNGLLFVENA